MGLTVSGQKVSNLVKFNREKGLCFTVNLISYPDLLRPRGRE